MLRWYIGGIMWGSEHCHNVSFQLPSFILLTTSPPLFWSRINLDHGQCCGWPSGDIQMQSWQVLSSATRMVLCRWWWVEYLKCFNQSQWRPLQLFTVINLYCTQLTDDIDISDLQQSPVTASDEQITGVYMIQKANVSGRRPAMKLLSSVNDHSRILTMSTQCILVFMMIMGPERLSWTPTTHTIMAQTVPKTAQACLESHSHWQLSVPILFSGSGCWWLVHLLNVPSPLQLGKQWCQLHNSPDTGVCLCILDPKEHQWRLGWLKTLCGSRQFPVWIPHSDDIWKHIHCIHHKLPGVWMVIAMANIWTLICCWCWVVGSHCALPSHDPTTQKLMTEITQQQLTGRTTQWSTRKCGSKNCVCACTITVYI